MGCRQSRSRCPAVYRGGVSRWRWLAGWDEISLGVLPTLDALGLRPRMAPDGLSVESSLLCLASEWGGEVLWKVCLVIWSLTLQLLGTEKQSADSLAVRLAARAGCSVDTAV